MGNLPFLLALHRVNGLGPIRLKAVLDHFENPQAAWEAPEKDLLKVGIPEKVVKSLVSLRQRLNVEDYYQSFYKMGIKILTIFDENYPQALKEIYDPPVVIYYQGEILPEDSKALGVVGTRKVTGYGKLVTEKFVTELVEAGVTIISGLARGVDTQAHKKALEVKGRTLAILGGGLKNIFPPENTLLAKEIIQGHGAVLSEFPPDYPSLPGNFPARNRIISGLSRGVLVTEAAEDSGSLITAKLALDQGREVFAVPGPITSDLSKGPSLLIKQGAKMVTEPGEILEELGISKRHVVSGNYQGEKNLSEIEQKILACLISENKHVDQLCLELQLSAAQVSASLIKMEIYGVVKNLGGGNYLKVC